MPFFGKIWTFQYLISALSGKFKWNFIVSYARFFFIVFLSEVSREILRCRFLVKYGRSNI